MESWTHPVRRRFMIAAPQATINFHARIDLDTEERRRRLQAQTGLSAPRLVSEAFRELERQLNACRPAAAKPRAPPPIDGAVSTFGAAAGCGLSADFACSILQLRSTKHKVRLRWTRGLSLPNANSARQACCNGDRSMKGRNSPGGKDHPVWHGGRHRRRTSAGIASIKISHSVTSDSPDGRPWPPPDRGAVRAVVRRVDGCTLWRAIQLAQVRSAAPDVCNFPRQQMTSQRR